MQIAQLPVVLAARQTTGTHGFVIAEAATLYDGIASTLGLSLVSVSAFAPRG
jgi:hypothetical protein